MAHGRRSAQLRARPIRPVLGSGSKWARQLPRRPRPRRPSELPVETPVAPVPAWPNRAEREPELARQQPLAAEAFETAPVVAREEHLQPSPRSNWQNRAVAKVRQELFSAPAGPLCSFQDHRAAPSRSDTDAPDLWRASS